MRASITILLVLAFSDAHTFMDICPSSCDHCESSHKGHPNKQAKSSDHDCCSKIKEKSNKTQSHDCDLGNCMVSIPTTEVPVLTTKTKSKKQPLSPEVTTGITAKFFLASLSNKALSLYRSDQEHLSPKVPLYLYFQKLLIP